MILLNEARAAVARSRLGHVCRVRTSAIGPCRSGMLTHEALTTAMVRPPVRPLHRCCHAPDRLPRAGTPPSSKTHASRGTGLAQASDVGLKTSGRAAQGWRWRVRGEGL